jgi:hypothetical protein
LGQSPVPIGTRSRKRRRSDDRGSAYLPGRGTSPPEGPPPGAKRLGDRRDVEAEGGPLSVGIGHPEAATIRDNLRGPEGQGSRDLSAVSRKLRGEIR